MKAGLLQKSEFLRQAHPWDPPFISNTIYAPRWYLTVGADPMPTG